MPTPKKTKAAPRVTAQPQKKKRQTPKSYTDEERKVILAQLAANGYNYSRTERETGVARSTLLRWAENPPDATAGAAEIDSLKKELQESYLEKAKRAREVLLDRMISVAESERDLFKLSGAFKTVADAASQEEVNNAVASRIRGHSAVSQPAPAPGADAAGSAGGANPTIN